MVMTLLMSTMKDTVLEEERELEDIREDIRVVVIDQNTLLFLVE